jgi:hypothetical protein
MRLTVGLGQSVEVEISPGGNRLRMTSARYAPGRSLSFQDQSHDQQERHAGSNPNSHGPTILYDVGRLQHQPRL